MHPVRLVFMTDACDERMLSRCLGGVKDLHRARARGDDSAVRKANPFVRILGEQGVSFLPVLSFILLPVGIDPFGNVRW